MITQKTIQRIMATAKVEEIIEDFVNLRRRGVNLLGLCPFHDEKTPSFTVSPSKNIYKCFGCGKGGDSVRFIMDHEGYSYPEALKYVARKYNIEIEETEDTQQEKDAKALNDSLYIINEYAKEYFQKNLNENNEGIHIGKSYFKERGYTDEIIEKFDLGYALDDYTAFYEWAQNKKISIDLAKELGLVSKNDKDFFRARVMFSIHNISGKVIAFAGRTLSSNKKTPKYINSPETPIYNKSEILYGIAMAKNPIRKEDECIIVEGYTDVLTLFQGGIENVVASSGTSLTPGQIRLVKRYTPNIKIIYDGDAAGIKAALRGLDLVLEQDMNVRLVMLPEGEDPDSYMRKAGKDGFNAYLKEKSEDFVLFKINLLLKEAGTDPILRSQVLQDIVNSIAKVPDPLKRAMYIKECSRIMEINEKVIVDSTNKAIRDEIRQKKFRDNRDQLRQARTEESFLTVETQPRGTQDEAPSSSGASDDYYQERDLLRILLNFGNQTMETGERVSAFIVMHVEQFKQEMQTPLFIKAFDIAKEKLEENVELDVNDFINHQDQEIQSITIDLLTSPHDYANWEDRGVFLQNQKKPEDNFEKDAMQSMYRFLLRKVDLKRKEIEHQIELIKNDPEEEDNLKTFIKIILNLNQKRNEIAEKLGTVTYH